MNCKEFKDSAKPGVNYTIDLIKDLHAEQTDQSGKPYVNHPLRVANNIRKIASDCNDDIVMAALLHDTIEDCGIDETFLRQNGYSEDCITTIKLVTKPKNDKRSYDQVIDDLTSSGNRNAMIVKLADNMDNLHPERVRNLMASDPEKAQRLGERYRASIEKLCSATGINKNRVFKLIDNSPNLENMDIALK